MIWRNIVDLDVKRLIIGIIILILLILLVIIDKRIDIIPFI